MATPTTSDTLATLLASLSTTYTIRFLHNGTWQVLNASGDVVYRGFQAEVMIWLNQQPTA